MSNFNEAIFVRPRWEDSKVNARFEYLMDYAYWTGAEIVDYSHNDDLRIHELNESRANRNELKNFLDFYNPRFFFHFSHGGADLLTGQDMSVLISCNDFNENGIHYSANHILLRNRVVYTLSCSSARELGPKTVELGCIAYIGYKDPLWAVTVKGPDKDFALFEIWTGGAKQLISGENVEKTYDWLKRRYKYWINYWEMIDATSVPDAWVAPIIISVLEKNLKALTALGDLNATIRD